MYDLYLFADEDLPQDWERAEYSRESGASIHDPVRQMVDLDAVRKVSHSCPRRRVVRVGDDDDMVAAINQFLTASALFVYIIHRITEVTRSVDHIRTTAGRYDFLRLLVEDRRNQISYYTR
jgi:hypothetical protein